MIVGKFSNKNRLFYFGEWSFEKLLCIDDLLMFNGLSCDLGVINDLSVDSIGFVFGEYQSLFESQLIGEIVLAKALILDDA